MRHLVVRVRLRGVSKSNRDSVPSLLSKLSLVPYPAKREIIMHGANERSLHSTCTLHSTAHILTPQINASAKDPHCDSDNGCVNSA